MYNHKAGRDIPIGMQTIGFEGWKNIIMIYIRSMETLCNNEI